VTTEKTAARRVKRRLILDCKQGPDGDIQKKVKHKAGQAQRVIRPRPLDCVLDALRTLTSCSEEEDIEWLVLGFMDASFHIPFCGQVPRALECLLDSGARQRQRSPGPGTAVGLSHEINPVPWLARRSSPANPSGMQRPKNTIEHDHGAGLESVGRKLAFQKGAKGSQVRWIDVTWTRTDETLETSLKQEMLEEVQTATTEFVDSSVVAVINMKTHTGNCNLIADIETVWRPALAEPWVALAYQDKEEPRPGSTPGVSGKVDEALAWTNACLQGMAGTPVVQYTLEGFHTIPGEVQITTDPSPRELGALLVVRGTPIAWFATALTEEDVQAFGQAVGDPCEHTGYGRTIGRASDPSSRSQRLRGRVHPLAELQGEWV